MKKTILSLIAAFMLIGCGESGNTVTHIIEHNATIPFDVNTTISEPHNVSSIVIGNGSAQIICDNGSTCDITFGNKDNSATTSNTTDNSVATTDNHSVVDNSVVDNHSGDTNATN